MASIEIPNGLTIEYDSFGNPANPALLLVMGYGAQMIHWRPGFASAWHKLEKRQACT